MGIQGGGFSLADLIKGRIDTEPGRKQQANDADNDSGLLPPRLFFFLMLQADLANLGLGRSKLLAKFVESWVKRV
jgi:hypothetical protein